MRSFILIVGSVMLAFLGFVCLFKMLVGTIYESYGCEQFTIDNIEVRTGIDIPAVSEMSCEYDSISQIKKIAFKIDSTKVLISDWLQKNDFQMVEQDYLNHGQKPDTKWEADFSTKSNELHITLYFI